MVLSLLGVTVIMAVAAGAASWMYQAYVFQKAEENITNLLLSHKGIHHYVQNTMLPAYEGYQKEHKISPAFYAPELLSSSFIVRNQHVFYNQERKRVGYPELYYKLAAKNPRNPVNKADALERDLIRRFNADRQIASYKEIINLNGEKVLYVAIPFLKNEAHCMRCHGRREDAPVDLQQRYPGEGGFNEQPGEIRAITSIRAPLEHEYQHIYTFGMAIFAGFLCFMALFFFNTRLRSLVMRKTESLKEEIEERKRTEKELKIKESAIDYSINGIVLADLDGNLTYVNRAMLNLWRIRERDAVLGHSFLDLWSSGDEAKTVIDTLLEAGDWLGELQGKRADGSGFEVQVSSWLIRNEQGEALCLMASFLDVTEKHQIEHSLRVAQRLEALGTLGGGIAHDFNNILAPILGYADLVQDELPEGHEAREHLQAVIRAAERAKDLVRQILAFSRRAEHARQPVQLAGVVEEVVTLLQATLPATIEIRKRIQAESAFVLADPTQIHQVLMNLCTNAYHAMQETGGILGVGMSEVEIPPEDSKVAGQNLLPGSYLRIEISDTGCGMASDVVERIFEPYFTTKEKGKGTGLGLSIVHGIIKGYGGHISVYSEPGQGSTFCIYLPRMSQEVEETRAEALQPVPGGEERILLVDDEESLVHLGKTMLQHLGYRVTALTSSQEAWALLQKQPDAFELLLTDMTMPRMTGLELAQRYLLLRPSGKVILITGFSELVNDEKARLAGIRKLLMKPVVKRELALAVRQVLDET